MTNYIQKIEEGEVKVSEKNGKSYKTVGFATLGIEIVEHPVLGRIEVKSQKKVSRLNRWETNLQGIEDQGYSDAIGSFFKGDIVTRKVTPYQIEGRTVDTSTRVVFGDTADKEGFAIAIERAFRERSETAPAVPVPVPAAQAPALAGESMLTV